jgi:short-subunit dehydrogenase
MPGDKAMNTETKPLALITGASSGIGAAFARRLARDGHDLVLAARRGGRLEELAARLERDHRARSKIVAADLSDPAGIETVEKVISSGPPPEILVCSAGFGTRGHFVDIDACKSLAMIRLHVLAHVQLTRAVLPSMIRRGRGRVIIVSSIGAFFTTAHYVTYSATKSCLNTFCEGLQAELAGTGVSVQAVCPGLTRTEFMESPEYSEFNYGRVPKFLWMTPEQVVEESLASRDAIFIPGLHNRIFVRAMKAPLVGDLLGWTIRTLNRGSNTLY